MSFNNQPINKAISSLSSSMQEEGGEEFDKNLAQHEIFSDIFVLSILRLNCFT
jgi:hypothetical protein